MSAKIKHIGIMSQTAPRLFKFYECLLDIRRANSEATPSLENEHTRSFGYPILASKRVASAFGRTVIASDGNIGIAFIADTPASAVVWITSVLRLKTWKRFSRP